MSDTEEKSPRIISNACEIKNLNMEDLASERIKRIRKRFLDDTPFISIERAKYYTEKWQETENQDLPRNVRVALAMNNVFENMRFNIDPDDRIAGTWTENFLGIPIDIERGLFNKVFEIELKKRSMWFFGIKGNLKFAIKKIKKEGISGLLNSLKESKEIGVAMPSLGTETLDKRYINPYQINEDDKKELLKELLPYWDGKTIAEKLEQKFLEEQIYDGDFGDFIRSLPRGTAKNDMVTAIGAALGVWQGHLILDHESPIKKGLLQMKNEVVDILEKGNLTQEEKSFFESIKISLAGVIIYSERLADWIEQELNTTDDIERKEILKDMFIVCKKVPLYPAESFREAIQSYWTVKTAVELAMPFNVHAPGRLDQILYPYYKKDLQDNEITEEDACELLEELFLKIMSHNMRPYSNASSDFSQRYEGSEPVTMGGLDKEGDDATNDLTYIMLDAADKSKASLNFVVRIHDKTPEKLLMKVADLYYHGVSSISLMNDKIAMQALLNRGFTQEDARNYAITGCVDMCAPGKTGGEGFSSILLCRTLDLALRNGNAKTLVGTIKNAGLKTGEPDEFYRFDEFLEAFFAQADYMIKKIVQASKIRDKLYAEYLPAPFISAFMQGCLESKKDITQGGAIYDCEGILFMTSIANTVDSLYVIKKLIFERKILTFKELLDAIDHNYSGQYKHIHEMIMNIEGKWGNGNPECDELARKVTSHIFEETYKYRTYKDGFYAPFINSMTTYTYDGRISIATADGRLGGKPFAASCNPYNVEVNGPTGVLRSVSALDFQHVMGCAVNIRLHPSSIGKTEEARRKWISLVKTYFDLGGEQLQPTVVSTEVLRAAQDNPDKFRNIIVKVGGYSAYFVDLGREVQEEIISRTEHSKN
jgi:formate C-acetyltransferase